MAETAKKGANFTYEALALMSRLFYEKFGDDAIPIIRDVWYKMGLDSGSRLKEKLSARDFKSAAGFIHERNERGGGIRACRIADTLYHLTSLPGFGCDVGLENAGRPICEAVMSINEGQFKSLCGCDVEMNIVKSLAAGADCCEITYRPVDASGK